CPVQQRFYTEPKGANMFLSHLRRRVHARSGSFAQRLWKRQSHPCLERLEERCLLTINEFPTPTPGNFPNYITKGPDGNVWFTEGGRPNSKVAQVTPSGVITEFPILTPDAGCYGITSGKDANLWFTEYYANKVGRITPDGTDRMEYKIPTDN